MEAAATEEYLYLLVRSEVQEPDRQAFDTWYATDHMPKAIAFLGARKAWRYWSILNPCLHYAVYRCPALFIEQWTGSKQPPGFGVLASEFSASWPHVRRQREILRLHEYRP